MTDFIKLQGIFEEGYGIIAKKVMRDKALNVIAKSIYAYICSYSGKGNYAFPSQKLICNDLDISRDTLIKYTNQLKERGYITVKQEKEKGKFARNVYTVNIIPCMVYSDTVKTDTEIIGYDQVDTNNNNSLNNNNNINNNNDNKILRQSILELKKLIEEQFGKPLYPADVDKMIVFSKQYNVNPLEIYNNSDFLRGVAKKGKPTLRMWFVKETYKNMSQGGYVNFEDRKTEKNLDTMLKGIV